MSRAWRIEYEGALYHLMSRGNEGRDIFIDKNDLLGKVYKDIFSTVSHEAL